MTYFSLKVFLHSRTSLWRRLFSTANGSIRLWHAFCWTMFHRITLMASREQSDAGRWHTKMQLWSVCFIQIRNHPPTVTALLLALQILQADSGRHLTGGSTRGQNKLLSVKNYPSCFCKHKREPRGHSDVCWCQKHHIQSCCQLTAEINKINGLHYAWIPQITMLNHREKPKCSLGVSLHMDKTQGDIGAVFTVGSWDRFRARRPLI